MTTDVQSSFLKDVYIYGSQVRLFSGADWKNYCSWVGLMIGLLFSVSGFLGIGAFHGVIYPAYVWNIPLGTFIFVGAISFDTIGHLTAYKEELKKAEALVHQITIFAGITSIVVLCAAYHFPVFLKIPALTLVALSIFYSVIDEGMHWHRYLNLKSDRVEMWSHFFIFLGHTIMVLSWWKWFEAGYPGVQDTLIYLPKVGF